MASSISIFSKPSNTRPPLWLGINRESEQANGLRAWYPPYPSGGNILRDYVASHNCIGENGPIWSVDTPRGGLGSVFFDTNGTATQDIRFVDYNFPCADVFSDSFAVSCWFKSVGSTGATWQTILHTTNSGAYNQSFWWIYRLNSGPSPTAISTVGCYIDGQNTLVTPPDTSLNKWHHFALVFTNFGDNANKAYLYWNGKHFYTDDYTFYEPADFSGLQIGNIVNNNYPMDGKLWDLRLYNRALTASEILDIYRNPYDLWAQPKITLRSQGITQLSTSVDVSGESVLSAPTPVLTNSGGIIIRRLLPSNTRPPLWLGIDRESKQSRGLIRWVWPSLIFRAPLPFLSTDYVAPLGPDRQRIKLHHNAGVADHIKVEYSDPPIGLDKLCIYTTKGGAGTGYMEWLEPWSVPGDLTFLLWFKWEDNSLVNPGFMRSTGAANDFLIFNNTDRPWIRWNGADVLSASSGAQLQNGIWTHICYRVTLGSSANTNVFFNGKIEHTATSAPSGAHGDTFQYWGYQWSVSGAMTGHYTDVRVYDRALSNSEILDIYRTPYDLWQQPKITVRTTVTENTQDSVEVESVLSAPTPVLTNSGGIIRRLLPSNTRPPLWLGVNRESEQAKGLTGYWNFERCTGNMLRNEIDKSVGSFGGSPSPTWESTHVNFVRNASSLGSHIDFATANLKLVDSFTAVLWFRPTSDTSTTNFQYIWSKASKAADSDITWTFAHRHTTSGWERSWLFRNAADTQWRKIQHTADFTGGVWYMIAFSLAADATGTLYRDGQYDTSADMTDLPGFTSNRMVFGTGINTSGTPNDVSDSDCDIRAAWVYNRVLAASEILDIYRTPYDLWQQPKITIPTTVTENTQDSVEVESLLSAPIGGVTADGYLEIEHILSVSNIYDVESENILNISNIYENELENLISTSNSNNIQLENITSLSNIYDVNNEFILSINSIYNTQIEHIIDLSNILTIDLENNLNIESSTFNIETESTINVSLNNIPVIEHILSISSLHTIDEEYLLETSNIAELVSENILLLTDIYSVVLEYRLTQVVSPTTYIIFKRLLPALYTDKRYFNIVTGPGLSVIVKILSENTLKILAEGSITIEQILSLTGLTSETLEHLISMDADTAELLEHLININNVSRNELENILAVNNTYNTITENILSISSLSPIAVENVISLDNDSNIEIEDILLLNNVENIVIENIISSSSISNIETENVLSINNSSVIPLEYLISLNALSNVEIEHRLEVVAGDITALGNIEIEYLLALSSDNTHEIENIINVESQNNTTEESLIEMEQGNILVEESLVELLSAKYAVGENILDINAGDNIDAENLISVDNIGDINLENIFGLGFSPDIEIENILNIGVNIDIESEYLTFSTQQISSLLLENLLSVNNTSNILAELKGSISVSSEIAVEWLLNVGVEYEAAIENIQAASNDAGFVTLEILLSDEEPVLAPFFTWLLGQRDVDWTLNRRDSTWTLQVRNSTWTIG